MWKKLYPYAGTLKAACRAAARDEGGSVAVEMGLCSILSAMLLTGMVSFGSAFFIQGTMADTARDTARRLALGQITADQADSFAQSRLVNWGMTYTITATNDGTDATVQITVPAAQAAIVDYMGLFGGNLTASVTMSVES